MKRRVAKKIYKTVNRLMSFNAYCLIFYTTLDVDGRFTMRNRPYEATYSRDQFARAMKTMKYPYPKSKLGRQGTSSKARYKNLIYKL